MKKILTIILLFLSISILSANERDAQLDKLFNELKKNISSSSSSIAQQIWTLWSTHPTDQKLTSILDEGSRLVQDQKLYKAIEVFTKAIELDPNCPIAHSNLGLILRDLGKTKEAESSSRKAIELNPSHYQAYSNLGSILNQFYKL